MLRWRLYVELTARSNEHSFNQNKSAALLVNANRTANVFNTTINCQSDSVPFDASVTADVDVVANAQLNFGLAIAGTLGALPKLEAAVTAELSGSINGALRIQSDAEGTFSNSVTIFDFPLPGGIVIPGYVYNDRFARRGSKYALI